MRSVQHGNILIAALFQIYEMRMSKSQVIGAVVVLTVILAFTLIRSII